MMISEDPNALPLVNYVILIPEESLRSPHQLYQLNENVALFQLQVDFADEVLKDPAFLGALKLGMTIILNCSRARHLFSLTDHMDVIRGYGYMRYQGRYLPDPQSSPTGVVDELGLDDIRL